MGRRTRLLGLSDRELRPCENSPCSWSCSGRDRHAQKASSSGQPAFSSKSSCSECFVPLPWPDVPGHVPQPWGSQCLCGWAADLVQEDASCGPKSVRFLTHSPGLPPLTASPATVSHPKRECSGGDGDLVGDPAGESAVSPLYMAAGVSHARKQLSNVQYANRQMGPLPPAT